MSVFTRVQNQKRTAAEWLELNPVLADGEIITVVESGAVRFKVGDGVTEYVKLPYTDAKIWREMQTKLSATVSSNDAGKVLGIDVDGNIVPVETLNTNLTWGDVFKGSDNTETTYTPGLDLKLPGYEAPIDVKDLNANFEALEAAIPSLEPIVENIEVLETGLADAVTKIDAVNPRLDNIIANLTDNPENAVAVELADIRLGADGTLHTSAGAAVRAIGADVDELKANFQTINPDDLGLEQDEDTMLVYPTFKGVRSINGIPLAGGTGGGGGGGLTSKFKLRNTTGTNAFTTAYGEPAIVSFFFSSVDADDDTPTGNGTASYYINDELVYNQSIPQGDNSFNLTPYLKKDENKVKLLVTDVDGNSNQIIWTIQVVEIRVESSFDYTIAYPDSVAFRFTAIGSGITKTIHFILDGVPQETMDILPSNRQTTVTFENLTHGIHTLECYATAEVNGSLVTSNVLNYDIIVTNTGAIDPIISINYNVKSVLQGELVDIPYIVYDPLAAKADAEFEISYIDENGQSVIYKEEVRNIDKSLQHWTTRHYPLGEVTFRIRLRDTERSVTLNVTEFKLPIEPVEDSLELYLSSAGRSNAELNPGVWEYKGITTTFNNVNWASSGWIADANGDTALHLGGGSTAVINYKPFNTDLRIYGRTLEFEFAVRDVNNRNANVISCMVGNIGINITADKATLGSDLQSISCHFRDERKMRLTFVIESTSEDKLMFIYIDGVMTSVINYGDDNFQQRDPAASITIGSPYCSVDLYTVRSYNTALLHTDVIGNYLCDIADLTTKAETYDANDLYDDELNLMYNKVKKHIPVMTIIGDLPMSKGDKKDVEITYYDPNDPEMCFENRYCKIDVQGTSSQGYIRKNYKLKFNDKFAHIKGEIPTKVYCMKCDYAEATSTHNTGIANLAHTLYSEPTPAQKVDPRCRTTIEGFPIVIYHQETLDSEPYFLGRVYLPK